MAQKLPVRVVAREARAPKVNHHNRPRRERGSEDQNVQWRNHA